MSPNSALWARIVFRIMVRDRIRKSRDWFANGFRICGIILLACDTGLHIGGHD
jgi:hypothetical protein